MIRTSILTILLLILSLGCNNPNGGSVISRNHTPLLKPPGPFKFTQARAKNGVVSLRWSPSARVESYQVFKGTTNSSITEAVTNCSGLILSCSVSLDDLNTTYYFSVEATNSVGKKIVNNSVPALSVASFDLTSAIIGDKSVTLSWDTSSGATSYQVLYGTRSGVYSDSVSNVTSPYVLSGLTNGVNYYFRIVATNPANGYAQSNDELSGTPFGPPPAPAGLGATPNSGSVTLNWSSVAGVTSYKIYKGTASGSLSEIATGVSSNQYIDTVVNGTTYFYAVKAFNGFDSPFSTEVSVQSISNFSLNSMTVGPAAGELTLNWNSASGATAYDIRYGSSATTLNQTVSNVTSPHVLSGLSNTTFAKVIARNSIGVGASIESSNTLSASPVQVIPAPSALAASAVPGQVSLSWNNVPGATSYEVLRGNVSGTHTSIATGVTSNSYVDSTVSDGTSYFYVVRSFNGLYSVKSSEASIRPISNVSISSVSAASNTALAISWNAVPGATAYDILYGTTSGTYSSTVTGVTSPYSLTGLSANTTYYFRVRARNNVGSGTNVLSVQESQKTKTGAPTGLVASAQPGQVTLNWIDTAGATSYSVYRGTTTGTHTLLSSGLTSSDYVDSTASNGTTYFYVVTANNGAESASSTEVQSRPIANFTISSLTSPGSTSLQVSWSAVSGASTYDIRYGTSTGVYTSTLTNRTSPATITGLNLSTTYYVQVIAKNTIGSGASIASTESSQTTIVGAPSGLTATALQGQINLSWTSVSGATSYSIYRGTSSGSYSPVATNILTSSYVDSTIDDGTQYFYVITAFNGGESAYSNESTARSIAPFSIDSTSALSTTSIQVSWPAAAGASAYDLRYGTASGALTQTVTNVTSPYTLSGLSSGTTYYLVVRARNTIGSGFTYNTAQTSQLTPLGAPTGVAISAVSGSATISWNSLPAASSYKIFRGTTSGSHTLLASGITDLSYQDTTVSNGTTYFYVVKSFNGSDSANSSEVSVRPIANFTVTTSSSSSTSIQATWTAPAGANSYDLLYGTSTGTYTTTLTNVTSPYTISGLTPNTSYFVVIRAKNTVGSGTNTVSSESSSLTAFGAPTGLVATSSPGQVGLNWGAISGASSYNVYRGTSSGSLSLLQSSVSTNAYLDTAISHGTTYFYAVTAFNGAESAQSGQVSIKPIATLILTGVTAASSTSLNITWSSAVGADAYDVRYGTTSGVYLATVSNVTSTYTLTGLSPNTTYFVSIRARNSIGAGVNVNSNELNATTAVPSPSGLAATAVTNQVTLNWPAVSGASSYNIYRGTSSGTYSQIASGVNALNFADSTVSNGTTYYYMIRAFNGIESSNSNEVVILPMATFSISAVTALSSSSAQVSWIGPPGATSYDILYGTATSTYSTTVTNVTSPYSMTGLIAGGTYFVVVRAKNNVGSGSNILSTESSVTTPTLAPASLTATSIPGQVTLNWATTSGASSYRVYRGTTSGVYSLLASNIATTTYADSIVVNGTSYFYVVRAFNGTESVNSTEASSRPISDFSISSVTPLSSNSLQVSWDPVSGASTYNVRYGTTSGVYSTTLTNRTSPFTITGLSANTTYFIRIQAQNTIGSGATVNSSESSQITPLSAPSSLTATGGASQVNLSWSSVSGASSYKIYRGTSSGSHTLLASGVSGTSYSDTSADAGTSYFYVARAFNGADSANSNEVTSRPIASFTISSITSSNSTNLVVSWSAPAGASSYDLSYGTTSGTYTTTLTNVNTPVSINGLNAATTYFVRISAKNTVGTGTTVHSTQSSGTTNSLPVLNVIANQTMEASTSLPVAFNLTDNNDILSCSSSMSASSSNTTLIPNSNIIFSGSLPNCIATITPNSGQQGSATITLTANDGKDSASRSFIVDVTGCAVANIVWETQPTNTAAGTSWASAPRVSLRKADNSLCTTNLDPVSLAVSNDTSTQQDATILGTDTVIPSGGYATFTGAMMTRSGSAYTLLASQGSVESLESSTFNITALTPSRIVFSVQPPTTDMLVTITPSPVVRVADTYGNFVTGSSNTVALTLMDNTEGASLGGTLSRTGTSAITYTGLTVNKEGSYFIRATSTLYGTVDSNFFDIRLLIPQNVSTTLDMLLGPVTLATSTSKTSFSRSIISMGSNFIDGTTSYTWSIVAQNTNASVNSTIRLRIGTTNIAAITVPANTLTPTRYSASVSNGSVTATGNWTLRAENGTPIVTSSKIHVTQTNANKTLIVIPLTSLDSSSGLTITNTTMGNPNQQSFIPYQFNKSKFSKIDTAILHISGRKVTGNFCGQLWNKTTNTAITTTETCITNTAETHTSATVNFASLPASGEIEFRARTTTGSAVLFKASLILRIVGVEDVVAIQKVAGLTSNAAASLSLVEHRTASSIGGFGSALVNQYLSCYGRATVSGTATLLLRDHALNNSGNSGATTITASNINFSNQSNFTSIKVGPLATTNGNNMFMNFNWTSGSFDIGHCLLETEAVY